jgi:cyanate lyase
LTSTESQAESVGKAVDLNSEAITLLQQPPYEGSLLTVVPTKSLLYSFCELHNVYGTTRKALMHEEFGDDVMSAIDFDMVSERLPESRGDHIKITMGSKSLLYKIY